MAMVRKDRIRTKPPETSKHGQLKTDRKTRHTPVLVEDLAVLEDLNEAIVVDTLSRRFKR